MSRAEIWMLAGAFPQGTVLSLVPLLHGPEAGGQHLCGHRDALGTWVELLHS